MTSRGAPGEGPLRFSLYETVYEAYPLWFPDKREGTGILTQRSFCLTSSSSSRRWRKMSWAKRTACSSGRVQTPVGEYGVEGLHGRLGHAGHHLRLVQGFPPLLVGKRVAATGLLPVLSEIADEVSYAHGTGLYRPSGDGTRPGCRA